jgi:membrane-bound lytic murein transglycosylase F
VKKRSIYSRTRIAFDLYYPEAISLTLSQNSNSRLLDELDEYLDQSQRDGSITSLKERFFGHAVDVNPRGSKTFFSRVDNRLPHYLELIERVAKKHQLDWRLLAAIAYQESHWNPNAVSPTGVRGMMMLTHKAAEDMGIENRIDPTQSLEGGAKYYKSMYRRLPKKIQEPDRSWFALAAYNVGLGHLLDARRITEFQGGNPNRWSDVKKHLPLLEKKDWYQYTRHGFARGQEPVNYVQHIRHFHDLLQWRFPQESKPNKPAMQISIKDLDDVIEEAQAHETVTPKVSTLFPLRQFIL